MSYGMFLHLENWQVIYNKENEGEEIGIGACLVMWLQTTLYLL